MAALAAGASAAAPTSATPAPRRIVVEWVTSPSSCIDARSLRLPDVNLSGLARRGARRERRAVRCGADR